MKNTDDPKMNTGFLTFQEVLENSGLATPKDLSFKGLKAYQGGLLSKVDAAWAFKQRIGIEVSGGGGKTILSAAIAKPSFLAGGKILYISSNPISLSHFETEYKKVLGSGITVSTKSFSGDADVNMLTPTTLRNEVEQRLATVKGILKDTTFIVLDEVHRIPDDPEGETKVIGRVLEIINEYAPHAKVLAMSGTFYRMDEKKPAGFEEPDFRITMQDLIKEGEQPDLYGIAVALDVDLSDCKATKRKEEIIIKMGRKKLTKYLSEVAIAAVNGCIRPEIAWAKAKGCLPGGHCFFVSRQDQADELTTILNKMLGGEYFVSIISNGLSNEELQKPGGILDQLRQGKLMGFVTVSKGAESLNVPLLKYCHIVARITSDVKLMQCVFRVMRPAQAGCESKNMACIVDYQIKKRQIIDLACGLRTVIENGGSTIKDPVNGGRLFSSSTSSDVKGVLLSEHEAWITKGTKTQSEIYKTILLTLAKAKWPKPNTSWTLKKLSDTKYLVKDKKNKKEMLIDV